MKKIYYILSLPALLALSSCVDDEGSNERMPINEVKIDGIEDNYYMIAHSETLSIPVTVEGTISGKNDAQFEYEWYYCNGGLTDETHQHTTISKEKDLVYPLDMNPGNYKLYFRVIDKDTRMQYETSTSLTVLSPFVRGFYLFGDKEDGTCGMDFVSMVEGRDTSVVTDIFDNTAQLRHAENLVFTGTYSEATTQLWAVAENGSASLQFSSTMERFGVRSDMSIDKLLFPTIDMTRPTRVLDVFPHAFGSANTCMARTYRCLLTDEGVFFTSLYGAEAYGNPVNCYSSGSDELVKVAPYAFYNGSSSYFSTLGLYDLTNHRFVRFNGGNYAVSNLAQYSAATSPFSPDQTVYTPVRDLIYGENGRGNSGSSYALMGDVDGNYFVYVFRITGYYASGMSKSSARQIDTAVAQNFEHASHYAFYSQQPVILYSVGADLWAYNYNTNKAKKVNTFDGDITYLAMDAHSDDNNDDFIVATYSTSEKGVVRKFEIADDPNDITVTEKEYQTKSYPWKTDLKVVKVEYRNATY